MLNRSPGLLGGDDAVVGVALEAVEHVLDGEQVDAELLLAVEPLLDELEVLLVEVVVWQLLVDGEGLHVDVLLRQLVTAPENNHYQSSILTWKYGALDTLTVKRAVYY